MVSNISLETSSKGFPGEHLRKPRHEQITSNLYLIKYCATFSDSCKQHLRKNHIPKASSSEISGIKVKTTCKCVSRLLKEYEGTKICKLCNNIKNNFSFLTVMCSGYYCFVGCDVTQPLEMFIKSRGFPLITAVPSSPSIDC